MLNWTRYPTTRPARPAAPPAPKAAPKAAVKYVQCCADDGPEPAVKVAAEAAARVAAHQLGIDPPGVNWFTAATPAALAYRAKYFPHVRFATWEGEPILGKADRHWGRRIWLNVAQDIASAIETARHETCHIAQADASLPLDEDEPSADEGA